MHARARSRLSAASAAATAVLLCCVTASPASAAAAPSKVATVSKAAKVKDPLAGRRKVALAALAVDTRKLAAVVRAGAGSTVLAPDEQDALTTSGVLQGVALRDDRVAIVRARSTKQITAAVAAAQRTLAGAALELSVSLAAETHLAAGRPVSDDADALSGEAQDAAAAGEDTTDVTTSLDAVAIDLESAQGDESSTFNDVTGLPAAPSVRLLKSAVTNATNDVALIDQDLSDAAGDLAAAQAAYDALSTAPGNGS